MPTAQQSGNDLNFYLLKQVAMKPKLQALEAKTKEMELDLAIKKEEIEALQNREFLIEFELESDNKFSIIKEIIDIKFVLILQVKNLDVSINTFSNKLDIMIINRLVLKF